MSRPVPFRKDFNGDDLRRLSRSSTDAKQARRLLTISLIYDGATRSEAARHGNVDVQSIRDWVLRFNAEGPEGLIDKKSTGAPTRLNAKQMAALARVVEDGPVPYLDGIVRWRLCDLVNWLHAEYRITVSDSTLSRILRDMGYRKLTARPRHHAQDPQASETFKKTSPPAWRKSGTACQQIRQ